MDETESGFVTGYQLCRGNPVEDDLLIPAIEQHKKRFGSLPRAAATDRGFSSRRNEEALYALGIGRVSTPRKGKKGNKRMEHESQLWFKDLQRFRAAGEAKISLLKRKYGFV